MDICGEIYEHLEGLGDVSDVFEQYNIDMTTGDEEDLRIALEDDSDLYSDICDVIYDDVDEVADNISYLSYCDVEDSELGRLLKNGNWARIESIIREARYYGELEDAVSDWWSDHEEEIKELQGEDFEEEEEEENYDEGFDESLNHYKPTRKRVNFKDLK